MRANTTDYFEEQLELFEDKPHFLHAVDCPNYCDYACNAAGFEQAEHILKMQILDAVFTELQ